MKTESCRLSYWICDTNHFVLDKNKSISGEKPQFEDYMQLKLFKACHVSDSDITRLLLY